MITESVSSFASIPGQEHPLWILASLIEKHVVPHALLFSGAAGIGKTRAAFEFAKACNCMLRHTGHPLAYFGMSTPVPSAHSSNTVDIPCSTCKSCRKIDGSHHPDVIHIRPTGPMIKIAQIREFCQTLAMRPYEARWRIAVISDADRLNPPAANALLKVLEEPPERTVIILTAGRRSDLLPTIVSRCRHIGFRPLPAALMGGFLSDAYGIPAEQAQVVGAMAGGSYDRGADMIRTGWWSRRNWLLAEIGTLSKKPAAVVLLLAEKLSRNKAHLAEYLDILQSWMRDVAVYEYSPDKILHKDLTDTIRYVSQNTDMTLWMEKEQAVAALQRLLPTTANLRLAVESMLFRILTH